MESLHDAPRGNSWLARMLTTDFCPWANRFVYWLKEPVGWFFLANLICVIVGTYLAPIGWTLAAALSSLIAVGIIWPAIAVRAVVFSLKAAERQCREDDPCELVLKAKNRLPLPVWGLAIEGFLDRRCSTETDSIPTVALAFVRALSTTTYRFTVRPELRGEYPDGDALITCSFPFGIWTAKKTLRDISPLMVWPKTYPITGQRSAVGRTAAEIGEGNRPGRTGDFLGIREYQRGDLMKQVNWKATAKTGDLVVTQRSGPQCSGLDVHLDLTETTDEALLADRIRVTASLLDNLHQSSVPLRLHLNQQCLRIKAGWDGTVQMMDALARIPRFGVAEAKLIAPSNARASLLISSDQKGNITVCANDPDTNLRVNDIHSHRTISRDEDLASQLLTFWTEVRDANMVA